MRQKVRMQDAELNQQESGKHDVEGLFDCVYERKKKETTNSHQEFVTAVPSKRLRDIQIHAKYKDCSYLRRKTTAELEEIEEYYCRQQAKEHRMECWKYKQKISRFKQEAAVNKIRFRLSLQ